MSENDALNLHPHTHTNIHIQVVGGGGPKQNHEPKGGTTTETVDGLWAGKWKDLGVCLLPTMLMTVHWQSN